MADTPIPETRTPEQLPRATAVSPEALTVIQEEGGPLQAAAIKVLLGRLISTETAAETEDDLLAELDYDEPAISLVYADPNPAKNGWYRKTGASGAGTWTQFEKLSAEASTEVQALVDEAAAYAASTEQAQIIAIRREAMPDFAAEAEAKYREALDRYRTIEDRVRAHGGTVIWYDPAAAGGGNGATLATAYNDLLTAILAASPGDTIAMNGTSGTVDIAHPNIPERIIFDGSMGVTRYRFDGRIFPGNATAQGGGVFRFPAPATTGGVFYNLRPDDQAGTTTGVNVATGVKAGIIRRWGLDPAKCVAHYGALKEVAATTTPANGQWSETGGFIYFHPFGAPSLADVNTYTSYCTDAAAFSISKTGGRLRGIIFRGFDTFCTPSEATGGGYGIRPINPDACGFRDIRTTMAGDHDISLYQMGPGSSVVDCVSVQSHGRSAGSGPCQPYNAFAIQNLPDADTLFGNCRVIAFPMMNEYGVPIRLNYSVTTGLSHTGGGATVLEGLDWVHMGQLDYLTEISANAGVVFNVGSGGASDDDTPGSFLSDTSFRPATIDESAVGFQDAGFRNKAYGCEAYGVAAGVNPNIEHRGCTIDPLGEGQIDDIPFNFLNFVTPTYIRFLGGVMKTGVKRHVFGGGMRATDLGWLCGARLFFEGTDDTQNPSFMQVNHSTAGRLDLTGTIFDGVASTSRMFLQANPSFNSATWPNVAAIVRSDGANIFGENLTQFVGSATSQTTLWTPKDAAWWKANVAGATTDLTGAKNPSGFA